MPVVLQINYMLRATFVTRLADQLGINVCHYRVTMASNTALTDVYAADALAARAAPAYKAYLPSVASFEGIRLQVIQPVFAPHVIDVSDKGSGTNVSEPLPTQTSLLVSFFTGQAGRNYRGRIYYPFWAEGDNDLLGKPNAAALSKADTVRIATVFPITLNQGADVVTLTPHVFSRELNVGTPIVGAIIREDWSTQRRRSQINRGDPLAP